MRMMLLEWSETEVIPIALEEDDFKDNFRSDLQL